MLRSQRFVWILAAVAIFALALPAAAVPVLSSISPTSGYPGTQVTFTGTGFGATQGTGSVWLGNKLAGSIVSWSNTQIVAVVASGAASGSGQVQQGGTWSNSIAFTVIKPSITSISPTSGYPGTQVTINGTNFGTTQGSGSVWLGNKLAGSIVSWSATQIVATVHATALSGSAQVQQNGVWGNAVTFTVIQPNITGISPSSAAAGDSITITGTNFGATQGSGSVWLGSKLAGSIVSWSNTQVVATVASGSITGNAQVQQGGVWSNATALTIVTPSLTSIDPESAYAGEEITLTGTNFGATQGGSSVWLGSKLAGSIVSWSDTEIVATIDNGSITGSAQVQRGGVWSNSIALEVITPHINSFAPAGAPVSTDVTIHGEGFGDTQGSGLVWLGNKYATVVYWDDSEIVATVASNSATGTAQVYQNGVWSNAVSFSVITCNPSWTASPMGSPNANDLAWFDDDLGPNDPEMADWDTSRYWSGTRSFKSPGASPGGVNYLSLSGFEYPPLKLNEDESLFVYTLLNPCSPTGQILIYLNTSEGDKMFSWGDSTLLEQDGYFPENNMGALPATGTWSRLEIDADTYGLADVEIYGIDLIHWGGEVWFDYIGKVESAATAKLTGLTHDFSPAWSTGTPITLTATADISAEYRFVVQDSSYQSTEVQAYSTDNTAPWIPAGTGMYRIFGYARAIGSDAEWETALVTSVDIPCMPQAPATTVEPTDRIVVDDEVAGMTTDHLEWTGGQKTLGTQSFRKTDPNYGSVSISNLDIPWEDGQSLVFYMLIDECETAPTIEMTIVTKPDWEHAEGEYHFFYWAASGSGDQYLGTVPEAGVWTRMEVPFSAMDDWYTPTGVSAIYFSAGYGGNIWYDAIGTSCAPIADAGEIAVPNDETTWFDDAPATGMTASGDAATDTTYTRFTGTSYSYRMGGHGTFAQSFTGATTPVAVTTGDALFVYAQFHPCNMPREVVISWHTTNNEWKRAYWGKDTIYSNGYESEIGFYRVGELPAAEWQMLSVPAAMLDLEGESIDGVKIETVDGLMWFQHFGIAPPRCPALAGTITTPQDEIVWFDDSAPSGATTTGTWTWTTPAATGTQSHTDGFAFGAHQHAFTGATGGPTFNTGDLLSVWAQFSFCEPPREIVVGSGSRFAYWGENLSDFGSPGGTFTYMGPVPAAGGWRRLEIPASVLDLENEQVTELLFGAYDGQVWFDRVSRMPRPPSITSLTSTPWVDEVGDIVEIDWSATGAPTLEYQLKARNIHTNDVVLLLDWTTATSYDWTTTTYGQWAIELYVRNAYSEVRDQFYYVQVGAIE